MQGAFIYVHAPGRHSVVGVCTPDELLFAQSVCAAIKSFCSPSGTRRITLDNVGAQSWQFLLPKRKFCVPSPCTIQQQIQTGN